MSFNLRFGLRAKLLTGAAVLSTFVYPILALRVRRNAPVEVPAPVEAATP